MAEGLFNKTKNKIIIAYDLLGKKHKVNLKNFKLRVSVYGILKERNKILLQRHPLSKQFGLPGGAIELGESINETLSREYYEETGLKVKPIKLIDITEDFFTWRGENAQSILIFYEVKKIGGKLSPKHQDSAEARYIGLNKLTKNNTQRVFWKIIKNLKSN